MSVRSDKPSDDPIGSDEEEEAKCGFCLFMKGGGCKEEFIDWEKCVQDGDDVSNKCFEITKLLRICMDAHPDYYEPVLRMEKAMEERVVEEESRSEKKAEEGAEDVMIGGGEDSVSVLVFES